MIIQSSIDTENTASTIWCALFSTEFHYQRGGHFKSSWLPNGHIGWLDKNRRENFIGKILQIENKKYVSFLKYDTYKFDRVVALVTFQVQSIKHSTRVSLSADIFGDKDSLEKSRMRSWINSLLDNLPTIATKIHIDAIENVFFT